MWHKVKDLSADRRLAIESLLGRRLRDDEGLNNSTSPRATRGAGRRGARCGLPSRTSNRLAKRSTECIKLTHIHRLGLQLPTAVALRSRG